jgi:hypothetical protein
MSMDLSILKKCQNDLWAPKFLTPFQKMTWVDYDLYNFLKRFKREARVTYN